MGNYKNKKQKQQMRFFAIVALLGTAAALRLGHVHKAELAKVAKTSQLNHVLSKKRAQRLIKAQWDELTDEQMSEENGTITKKEAHDALVAFGKKHDLPEIPPEAWKELEAMFDEVDTNDDGEIDLEEFIAACE